MTWFRRFEYLWRRNPKSSASFYIAGGNSFAKPLKPDEEKEYLVKCFEGDNDARNILIERNLRLVAHIAKKYSNCGVENEDIISIGTIGLIKGISTFKPDKGTRLATYAARCIENEILMHLRTNRKSVLQVSLYDSIGEDKEGSEVSLIEVIPADCDEIFEEVDLKVRVRKMYKKIKDVLSHRERLIIALRYGLFTCGIKTQNEIAKTLGISRSYVSRIEKKALKKLGKEMQENI